MFVKIRFCKLRSKSVFTSPLGTLPSKTIEYRFGRGKVCFHCEQKLASIRKMGEGPCRAKTIKYRFCERTQLAKPFNPSPIFLTLVPRVEKYPLPQGARVKAIGCNNV